ncbi:Bax inhibitor-1/YccA family protein [Luteipulveratus mongoliensis]|uniref:Integral membrane protein n=1 Tax=Luteipulveratus mongoliensis TaxID=571913 RepID=A0A0K1JGW3_9MICO|nr:Bax inhibitor-1/YccA family protein [Luteipulveratus mongoliensis]AKU15954.1 integral membrane protein [Luteipulveratus mongoliensis]
MASNPVFNRFEKQLSEGGYANFGQGQSQQGNPQQGQPGRPGRPGPQDIGGAWGAGQDQLSSQQLEQMYNQGTATPQQTGRMTLDDVVMKTLSLFAIVLVVGAGAWIAAAHNRSLGLGLLGVGIVGTLGLGLLIAFKKTLSVPLIVLYAVLEGLFVGAISQAYEGQYKGVVPQAIVATACVFIGMFAGWKFGLIKVTERSRRIFGFAILGYFLFAIANFVLTLTGVFESPFGAGGTGWLGIGISVFAIGLASYSLAIDFDTIERGVSAGLPEKYSWLMAHGLVVSVVWLYLEILRLLARLRD